NSQLTRGLDSPGVNGSHTAAEGLRLLLAGTGLQAVRDANGEYTLLRIPAPSQQGARGSGSVATLSPVTITSSTQDGSAQSGYVAQELSSVGPWQGRRLQDTPYAISSVPAELI